MRPNRLLSVSFFLLYCTFAEHLEGPFVCTKKEKIQTTKLLPYQRAYQFRTYEFCFDARENFQCPINKIGYKTAYKNVTKIEIITRETCCPGFVQEHFKCISSAGTIYGRLEGEKSSFGSVIAVIVVITFSCIALLLGIAFYYRRKYKREKHRTSYVDITSAMGKNEFGNPLYDATVKLSSFDNLHDKSELSECPSSKQSRVSNIYEELPLKRSEDDLKK